MEYHALATLVREATVLPPGDPIVQARLNARAAELGIHATLAADLLHLRTDRGWILPPTLQDEMAVALMWDTPPA